MPINYIALAIPAFFALIGVEILAARRLGMAVYRVDDAVTDLSCGIGSQVVGVFLKGALLAGYAFVFTHLRLVTWSEGSLVPWAVAFVGVDFLYYWWHRLSHEVAFMWAVHVVHHQSEDYNLAVALRQAWFSGATSWVFYLPLAVVGVPPLVFVTMNAFSTLYQFWIHTRTIGKLGVAEWVFNTASHHRVHHGRNPKYLDKNYAATLIVWDRLFGTFKREDEEPFYGVISPYASWNPVWANFDFWAHLVRKARSTPRFADKVRVFVRSPGWDPPGGPEHHRADVAVEPAVRFVTSTARRVGAYVLVQFVPVLIAAVVLITLDTGSTALGAAALAALVVATTAVWGALFERRVWAIGAELARIATVAIAAAGAFWAGAASAPLLVGILAWAAASSAWAFALRPVLAPADAAATA